MVVGLTKQLKRPATHANTYPIVPPLVQRVKDMASGIYLVWGALF